MSNEIVVREERKLLTPEQNQLLKDTLCKGADDNEFELFKLYCNKTKLDPFARQIYPVKRWDTKLNREVMSVQVAIDGLRVIAERSNEYQGQTSCEWCGEDGKWVDVWLSKEYPVAAKVGVMRKGFHTPIYAIAKWSSYVATYFDKKSGEYKLTPMWKKMPDLMLGKCAEALALRKAFPNDTYGLYTAEEMQQAGENYDKVEVDTNDVRKTDSDTSKTGRDDSSNAVVPERTIVDTGCDDKLTEPAADRGSVQSDNGASSTNESDEVKKGKENLSEMLRAQFKKELLSRNVPADYVVKVCVSAKHVPSTCNSIDDFSDHVISQLINGIDKIEKAFKSGGTQK